MADAATDGSSARRRARIEGFGTLQVAEWYVRDLIEKSRRGMEESVRQGWHTGGPVPYGYRLEAHPHPNPHKAREGRRKHRLVPDPVRAPIVRMIFDDYCLHGLGLGAICEKLNRDLDRHPPPTRNKKDENDLPQTWSRSQLHAMLRNPKYTGYNVWGRHDKRRGRPFIRPRDQWVWSPTPAHEPIIESELFDLVEERARRNEHRAKAPVAKRYTQRAGTGVGRLYPLRGRVRCALCGRRMEGSHQKGSNWYRCLYVYRRSSAAAEIAGHPRVVGIREQPIIEELFDFLGDRIFGPERLRLLRDELARSTASAWNEHQAELERLQHEQNEVERALYRQALRLEEHDDPCHPVVALAKQRIEELSVRRAAIADATTTLESSRPTGAHPDEIEAMLDAVPDLRDALPQYTPEDLAELFEALQVEAVYDKQQRTLEVAATLTPELVLPHETQRPPRGRSLNSVIAGAGFGQTSTTMYRFSRIRVF